MKIKRLLYFLMALIMIFICLSGCDSQTNRGIRSGSSVISDSRSEDSQPETAQQETEITTSVEIKNENLLEGNLSYFFGISEDGTLLCANAPEYDTDLTAWKDLADLDVGGYLLFALKTDGTILGASNWTTMETHGLTEFTNWTNVVSIASGGGENCFIAALTADGTVLCEGITGTTSYRGSGENKVYTKMPYKEDEWTDITDLESGTGFIVGLKSDGTVIAAGQAEYEQCDVFQWNNVEKIFAAELATYGIKSDGSICLTGADLWYGGQVPDWTNIKALSVDGIGNLFGLSNDGTIVCFPRESATEEYWNSASSWSDITDIKAADEHLVALHSDGHVSAVGNMDGIESVTTWQNVISIYTNDNYILGIQADGHVLCAGYTDEGPFNVSDWILSVQ